MFDTILIGVDGRQGGRDALMVGERLRALASGDLLAVHVVPLELHPSFALRPDIEAPARQQSEELLRAQLAELGVDARLQVTAATSPGRGLQRAAEAVHADVIVVGAPHRGAVGRVVSGDNVRAVLLGAGVPVVVARRGAPPTPGANVIGVGYDGSPESQSALAWAAELAQTTDGELRVLCAVEPPKAFSPAVSYGVNWGALAPEREEHAKQLVADTVARLGSRAVGEAAVGMAAEELRRLSRQVDMLVLGSHGYGPMRRALLGSMSDRLVHSAACPVVIVPHGAGSASESEAPAAVGGVEIR